MTSPDQTVIDMGRLARHRVFGTFLNRVLVTTKCWDRAVYSMDSPSAYFSFRPQPLDTGQLRFSNYKALLILSMYTKVEGVKHLPELLVLMLIQALFKLQVKQVKSMNNGEIQYQ